MARHREEYPSGVGFSGPPRPLADIELEGRALVRTALTNREQRPSALRRLAELVVDLRRYYSNEDGTIDYRGRTWDYRERIREMFDKWGVPADSEDNLQASLRYHVGNYLREVLTPEELVEAGLQPAGPRQRLQNTRDELRAIVRAIGHDEELKEENLPTSVALDSALRLIRLVEARPDLSSKVSSSLLSQIEKAAKKARTA